MSFAETTACVRAAAVAMAACIALMIVSLGGCTSSVNLQVAGEVPVALVETAPVTVGVYYTDEFRHHEYREDSAERENWRIDSGASQVAMFDRVLASMFRELVALPEAPRTGGTGLREINIVPAIQEMQFSLPAETSFPYYEAWIRYGVSLFDADGTLTDDWTFTAYGKAPHERFMSRTTGLHDAMELALRDAGAKLSTGLPQRPAMRAALASP